MQSSSRRAGIIRGASVRKGSSSRQKLKNVLMRTPRTPAGLFPEVYTGIDSTDPAVNGTLK